MQAIAATKQLRENPFQTYRDPQTGKWVVIPNPKPDSDRSFTHSKSL